MLISEHPVREGKPMTGRPKCAFYGNCGRKCKSAKPFPVNCLSVLHPER